MGLKLRNGSGGSATLKDLSTQTDHIDIDVRELGLGGRLYSATESYAEGDIVVVESGIPNKWLKYKEYISTVDNNTGKVPGTDPEWNDYNVVKWIPEDVTLTVSGTLPGHFTTLQDALDILGKYNVLKGAKIVIQILDGHVFDYMTTVFGDNFGFITIVPETPGHAFTIDFAGIPPADGVAFYCESGYFPYMDSMTFHVINALANSCVFYIDDANLVVRQNMIYGGASVGGTGLGIVIRSQTGTFWCQGSVFRDFGTGIHSIIGSFAYFIGTAFYDCDTAVFSENSQFDADGINIKNTPGLATAKGLDLRTSNGSVTSADLRINGIDENNPNDLTISRGCIVDATNSSFGSATTTNIWETAGMIYWSGISAEPPGPEPY